MNPQKVLKQIYVVIVLAQVIGSVIIAMAGQVNHVKFVVQPGPFFLMAIESVA